MAANLHFTFFAGEHIYFASVTRVLASGHPLEPPTIVPFRLPQSISERYQNTPTRYTSNIRGHDFLSHTGRWTDGYSCGVVDATFDSLEEIHKVKLLSKENVDAGYSAADLKICLGPHPGSFFADAYRLRRYHWANLPDDLENEVQRVVGKGPYGKILDVAINATGGWVMRLDEKYFELKMPFGKKWRLGGREVSHFRFGGRLPNKLEAALKLGESKQEKISHIYLNHQNADEYVLIFSDGHAYLGLHYDFQESIESLITLWAEKRRMNLKWHWESTCECAEHQQQEFDAAYYNHRGLFQLERRNWELALAYFREACVQKSSNREYHYNQRLALEAVRKGRSDKVLEGYLHQVFEMGAEPRSFVNHQDLSAVGVFRNQYLLTIESAEECRILREQLRQYETPTFEDGDPKSRREWSYALILQKERSSHQEIDTRSSNDQHNHGASRSGSTADSGYDDSAPTPRVVSELEGYPLTRCQDSQELEEGAAGSRDRGRRSSSFASPSELVGWNHVGNF